jgi:hypothetical protein
MEQSMVDAMAGLTADEDAEGNETGGGGDGADIASIGALGLGSSAGLARADARKEATLAQQLLAAYGAIDAGGAVGAASGAAPVPGTESSDARANALIVADVARSHRIDPVAAVAMMLVESGGNAHAIGDGGTSFGLFQLHEGGMLTAAHLTPEQAFDPATNAHVSIGSLAHEWAKGPNRTPGEIAAASQRPADPVGYARRVNAAMDRARALLA